MAPDHLNINYTVLQRIAVEFAGRVASTSLEYCLALTRVVKVIKQLQRHSPFVDEGETRSLCVLILTSDKIMDNIVAFYDGHVATAGLNINHALHEYRNI